MKWKISKYLPLLATVTIFSLIFIIGARIPQATIESLIISVGPLGIVLLIFLMWLSHLLAPLSASPLIFAGFFLYGPTVILYAYIAGLFSATTNFWIAKIWGERIVLKIIGEKDLKKIEHFAQDFDEKSLIIIRLFLIPFHDIVSYFFGLSTIRFFPYFIISAFATIPGMLIWYFLSIKITNSLIFTLFSWILGFIFLSGFLFMRKIKKSN